jgi:predicted RNase H-like HicB family nuclease
VYYTTFLIGDNKMMWHATAPALPDCTVDAPTRTEAIEKIQARVTQVVEHLEVLQLPLPVTPQVANGAAQAPEQTPWEWFGVFQNDPSWGALLAEIEQQRDARRIAE